MILLDLQEWNNLITAVGVVVNGALTWTIIRLTMKSTKAADKSAMAAGNSAKASYDTYLLSKQVLEIQSSKEERVSNYYRKFYSEAIISYAAECKNALLTAFNTSGTTDWGKLRGDVRPLPFEREDLILYFEYAEIDHIYKLVETFQYFRSKHVIGNYGYDSSAASSEASLLILEFDSIERKYT